MLTTSVPWAGSGFILKLYTLRVKGRVTLEESSLMLFKQAFLKFIWPESYGFPPPQVASTNTTWKLIFLKNVLGKPSTPSIPVKRPAIFHKPCLPRSPVCSHSPPQNAHTPALGRPDLRHAVPRSMVKWNSIPTKITWIAHAVAAG